MRGRTSVAGLSRSVNANPAPSIVDLRGLSASDRTAVLAGRLSWKRATDALVHANQEKSMSRTSLRFVFGSVILTAALSASADPLGKAEIAYRTHKAAIVQGDLQAAMSGLTDDVTYVAGPGCPPSKPCVGKDAVREKFVASAIGQKMQIVPAAVSSVSNDGASIRTRAEVSWPGIDKLGIQRIVGIDTVTMRDGKIASVVFVPDMADEQTAKLYLTPPPPAGK